jgi:FtsH-binding integral membrane protein
VFDISLYGGYQWRVRIEYRWAVGSTWLGTVVNSFTANGIFLFYADSFILNATGEGVCRI